MLSPETMQLHRAADDNNINAVLLALQQGADYTFDDCRVFRYAAERGQLELVQIFIENYDVKPDIQHNYAIRFAAENGHVPVVHYLLNNGCANAIHSALLHAVDSGQVLMIRSLLAQGADPTKYHCQAIWNAVDKGLILISRDLLNWCITHCKIGKLHYSDYRNNHFLQKQLNRLMGAYAVYHTLISPEKSLEYALHLLQRSDTLGSPNNLKLLGAHPHVQQRHTLCTLIGILNKFSLLTQEVFNVIANQPNQTQSLHHALTQAFQRQSVSRTHIQQLLRNLGIQDRNTSLLTPSSHVSHRHLPRM